VTHVAIPEAPNERIRGATSAAPSIPQLFLLPEVGLG